MLLKGGRSNSSMSTTILIGHATWISLVHHESLGGHTIARHVAKADRWLYLRLISNHGLPAASTFIDLAAAEQSVNQAIQANQTAFTAWLNAAWLQGRFDHDLGRVIGRGFVRLAGGIVAGPLHWTKTRVSVTRVTNAADPFFVLTAFPIV
jgi:hypothetical protein